MDRPVEDRGPNTSMLELKKIVDCLVTNGYEFEGTISEVIINRTSYPDDAIANFKKDIDYTAEDGNYINDNEIKISIQFQKRADYTNFKHFGKDQDEREDEEDEYIGDPDEFIRGLIGEEEIQGSTGGTRRKKRKTRKNRRKNSNRHRK